MSWSIALWEYLNIFNFCVVWFPIHIIWTSSSFFFFSFTLVWLSQKDRKSSRWLVISWEGQCCPIFPYVLKSAHKKVFVGVMAEFSGEEERTVKFRRTHTLSLFSFLCEEYDLLYSTERHCCFYALSFSEYWIGKMVQGVRVSFLPTLDFLF